MQTQLPEVQPGDSISAELFNNLVKRANDSDSPKSEPARKSHMKAVGEFWIKNSTSSTMEAFELVGLTGAFYNPMSSKAEGKSALANDGLILTARASSTSPRWAFTLEGIKAGGIGRACSPYGPLLFGFFDEWPSDGFTFTDSISIGAGYYHKNSSNEGEFRPVAIDSTSGLVACYFDGMTRNQCYHATLLDGASLHYPSTGVTVVTSVDFANQTANRQTIYIPDGITPSTVDVRTI